MFRVADIRLSNTHYASKAATPSSPMTAIFQRQTTGAAIWLLTGPNMAGKSTFLRQNALIALLAQMGSYVPAERAHIGLVSQLFSRVGASDDLARGRSTFMVEMVETAAILNQADDRASSFWMKSVAVLPPMMACQSLGPRWSTFTPRTNAGPYLPRIITN